MSSEPTLYLLMKTWSNGRITDNKILGIYTSESSAEAEKKIYDSRYVYGSYAGYSYTTIYPVVANQTPTEMDLVRKTRYGMNNLL